MKKWKIGKYLRRDEAFEIWQCPICGKETGQVALDAQGIDDVGCEHWAGNGIFVISDSYLDDEDVQKAVKSGLAWKKVKQRLD